MKGLVRAYFSLSMLCSVLLIGAGNPSADVVSKFTVRSQSNAVRRVVSSVGKRDVYNTEKLYWDIATTPAYSRSFDGDGIARALFGDSLCSDRTLKIEGSRVVNRDENALLADYFYLPTDFKSRVTFEPRISNVIVDFNIYAGLDNIMTGMYFWLQAPLAWTNWDLGMKERVIEAGINNHDAGYFTPGTLLRSQLLANFNDYSRGITPGTISQTINTGVGATPTLFQTTLAPLQCSKICSDRSTKFGLAEIRAALGWNFLMHEDYHFGLNVQVSAPTGTGTNDGFLFRPQIGNNNHWEVGGALTAHYTFWSSEDQEKNCGIYFDVNLTTLLSRREGRCFDLCGKPLSRYMLAERLGTPDTTANLLGNGTAPSATFANSFSPVANITKQDVKVHIGIQADAVAWFNYSHCGWSLDAGYNLFAHSNEKISTLAECDRCSTFSDTTWALKGDSHVFGFASATSAPLAANDPVALSATMSDATINGGDNFGKTGVTAASILTGRRNPNSDSPQAATAGTLNVALNSQPGLADAINTSIQPVFIKAADINFVRSHQITHKLFYGLSYTWVDKEEYLPYIGWGAEIEWAQNGRHKDCDDACEDTCSSCGVSTCDTDDNCNESTKTDGSSVKAGLSQWSVWAKLGVSFN